MWLSLQSEPSNFKQARFYPASHEDQIVCWRRKTTVQLNCAKSEFYAALIAPPSFEPPCPLQSATELVFHSYSSLRGCVCPYGSVLFWCTAVHTPPPSSRESALRNRIPSSTHEHVLAAEVHGINPDLHQQNH